jgi:hypothetical protein
VDICIGMDCLFLQLKHLERQTKGSLLHLFTSVFGGGFIMLGVELPETREDEPALEETGEDECAMEKTGEDEPALEETGEDKPALEGNGGGQACPGGDGGG